MKFYSAILLVLACTNYSCKNPVDTSSDSYDSKTVIVDTSFGFYDNRNYYYDTAIYGEDAIDSAFYSTDFFRLIDESDFLNRTNTNFYFILLKDRSFALEVQVFSIKSSDSFQTNLYSVNNINLNRAITANDRYNLFKEFVGKNFNFNKKARSMSMDTVKNIKQTLDSIVLNIGPQEQGDRQNYSDGGEFAFYYDGNKYYILRNVFLRSEDFSRVVTILKELRW